MIWVDTIIQGILLGGLYALFAAGLSLVFGIMRLVNLAHGDLIVIGAYLILLLVTLAGLSPFVAAASPCPSCSPRLRIAEIHAQPRAGRRYPAAAACYLRSVGGAAERFWKASQPTASASRRARFPRPRSKSRGSTLASAALTFGSALVVIVGLNQLFYRTSLGRAFRATSDDPTTASLMGIKPAGIFAKATGIAMIIVTIAALYLGMRSNFDPSIGPARLDLCLRGRHHRWPRLSLGHACGWHDHRRRADRWRCDQSGMADPGRAPGLPDRAACASPRPVPESGGLIMTKANLDYSVQTRTRASSISAIVALFLILVAVALPAFASRSLIQDMFFILTMLVLAQFWNLLAGYGGLVSVGQQAFVGIGAYAMFGVVILMGFDPVPSILIAGVAALLLAIPTAFFAFRLQGAYFAIGTWVIAEVVRLLVAQWKAVGGGTGTSLPRSATGDMWLTGPIEILFDVRNAAARDILAYWLAVLLAVATIAGIYWLLRTKRGLGLAAVRDNIEAAKSVGVDAVRMKWTVFLVSAFGTGLAGGLIYMQKARISPDAAFSLQDWTAYVIFIVVIGGIGTIEGPILGVLVFFILQSLLADYGSWYLMALGVIGIAIMLFAPRGLWGLFSDRTGIELFPVRRRLTGGRLANSPSSSKEE
jgi:branched-chain amino acid transport system permease protein